MRLYRSLVVLAALLALGVIPLGAYVRLSDAGLGHPGTGHHRNEHNGTGSNANGRATNGGTGGASPDFPCVRAQQAGTSWLHRQL